MRVVKCANGSTARGVEEARMRGEEESSAPNERADAGQGATKLEKATRGSPTRPARDLRGC